MPLDARRVRSCLENKLKCDVKDTDHTYFNLVENGTVIAWTKMSHGSKEIGKPLESKMAKQLGVSVQTFRDCVSCMLDRDNFIAARQENPNESA